MITDTVHNVLSRLTVILSKSDNIIRVEQISAIYRDKMQMQKKREAEHMLVASHQLIVGPSATS